MGALLKVEIIHISICDVYKVLLFSFVSGVMVMVVVVMVVFMAGVWY